MSEPVLEAARIASVAYAIDGAMPDGNTFFSGGSGPTWNDAMLAAAIRQSYGALAYSQSTGRYGWSFGTPDQASAESLAVQSCGVADAASIACGFNTYLGLAVADGGYYGYGWDSNPRKARERALASCKGANPHIAVLLHTRQGVVDKLGPGSGWVAGGFLGLLLGPLLGRLLRSRR